MPSYVFSCKCGESAELFWEISDRKEWIKCSCGKRMERNFTAEQAGDQPKCDLWRGHTSEAMAYDPSQIPEAMELDKQLGVKVNYKADGRPEFTSAKHKSEYAKAHGYHFKNSFV